MIISRERNFAFFKTTKVGGGSIEIALSRLCGPDDIITPLLDFEEAERKRLGYPGPQNYYRSFGDLGPIEKLRLLTKKKRPDPLFYNHISATEVRQIILPSEFDNLYKFSIMRNPFTYIESKYFWSTRASTNCSFKDWLFNNPNALIQNRKIMEINGKNAMNAVLRFEHLEHDFRKIGSIIGLDAPFFDDLERIKMKSGVRPASYIKGDIFKKYPETIELINLVCETEMIEHGYSLETAYN